MRVSVFGGDRRPFAGAVKVELHSGGPPLPLARSTSPHTYRAEVAGGTYELRVETLIGRSKAPERRLEVNGSEVSVVAYLGGTDAPFYRLNGNGIPFRPPDDLVAIVFQRSLPEPGAATDRLLFDLAGLGLVPLALDHEGEEHSFSAAEGSIWLFTLLPAALPMEFHALRKDIQDTVGDLEVRVGRPIELEPKRVTVLDNFYVVRFHDGVGPATRRKLVDGANGVFVRALIQASNAYLIEFTRGDYREHLETVERWYQNDLAVYCEPDLFVEIEEAQFPDDPPREDEEQPYLELQGVADAWRLLRDLDEELTLGSPDVRVATLDKGIELHHEDLPEPSNVVDCFDFKKLVPCSATDEYEAGHHGMMVYGIISAATDNEFGVAGIAPGASHIALRRPSGYATRYLDALLYAAGFQIDSPPVGWPEQPVQPGADIISLSHNVSLYEPPAAMDDTFRFLTTYGRQGRGTLLVYAAGNAGESIAVGNPFPAHGRTVAVSSSDAPDAGVERLNEMSNRGPQIDLCARGQGVVSLTVGAAPTASFAGASTSAAAPTVAAAAALMLTAEPRLTWIDLRDVLRATAKEIDPDDAGWVDGRSDKYGFGRVAVDRAVEGAIDFDTSAVNLVIRDSLADAGWTLPTGGPFWLSPDIWVRRENPELDPLGDPDYGAEPPHQSALAGSDNHVRVRVSNQGHETSSSFWVSLYVTHFPGTQAHYPADFIPSPHLGSPLPEPLAQATYLIEERSVDSLAPGQVTILDFLWPAALVPLGTLDGTLWQPTLLAEVSPHTGPPATGPLVADNSNLAQRSVAIEHAVPAGSTREATVILGHEADFSEVRHVQVQRGNLPKSAEVWLRFPDDEVATAVLQHLDYGDSTRRPADGNVNVVERDGQPTFTLASGSRLALDVPMAGRARTPVVIGVELPPVLAEGVYRVPLTEERPDGRPLGGVSLELVVV